MKRDRLWNASMLLAVTSTCGMALFHFFLPYVWGWGPFLATLPPAVRWGSYSINFFFSFLLLSGGLLTLLVWRTADTRATAIGRALLLVMCAFWIANVAYQLIIPMPMPRAWVAARFAFIGYALLAASAYAVAASHARVDRAAALRHE